MLEHRKRRILVVCLVAATALAVAVGLYSHHMRTSMTPELQRFYVSYSLDELQKMQQDADRGLRPELLDPEKAVRSFLEKGTSDQPPVAIAAIARVPDEPSGTSTDMLVYVVTLRDGRRIKLMAAQTSFRSSHPIWVVAWYGFLSKDAPISAY